MTTEAQVLDHLEALAPLRLAGDWDNVGLLIESQAPRRACSGVLLTIDLTPAVLHEAITQEVGLIVAYHPIIFGGLKRLRRSVPHEAVVLGVVEHGINVYSPHTALDAAEGGVNDWLLGAFEVARAAPIEPAPTEPEVGAGRLATLQDPLTLDEAVARVKGWLQLSHVRVAAPADAVAIERVAVCPGAGGSLFQTVRSADLFLTGEMRHHDVLTRVRQGAAVVLTEHTNSERGYLTKLGERLRARMPDLKVLVSESDRDPLSVR